MDKVYQVFVSSTFADLKDERLQLSNTLAKAGYIASGMELFPATDQQQFEYIKRVIDRCDYYIVIVAGRYGSLDEDNVSFTEKEFDYARSKGIPVLAFLHAAPEGLPVSKTDNDKILAQQLESFKSKLKTGRMVDFYTNTSDLCTKAIISVFNAANLAPGVGWIRGDQAIDPKVLQESERLRTENAELKERLSQMSADGLSFDPNLSGPSEVMTFELLRGGAAINVQASPGEIFAEIYNFILSETRESVMRTHVARALGRLSGVNFAEGDVTISNEWFIPLRNQLEALGLVKPISKTFGDVSALAWSATDKGRRYFASLRAIRKQPTGE
jgi:hypothetical protein